MLTQLFELNVLLLGGESEGKRVGTGVGFTKGEAQGEALGIFDGGFRGAGLGIRDGSFVGAELVGVHVCCLEGIVVDTPVDMVMISVCLYPSRKEPQYTLPSIVIVAPYHPYP